MKLAVFTTVMNSSRLLRFLEPVLDRVRRGPRKIWTNSRRAHIELRNLPAETLCAFAAELERGLSELPGVDWARVNPYLERVIVAYDAAQQSSASLAEHVAAIEARHGLGAYPFPMEDPERHPGDDEPVRRTLIAATAQVASLAMGALLRNVGLRPLAVEIDLAALLTVAEGMPPLRKAIERVISISATELGLAVARSTLQALIQGTTGPVAGALRGYLRLQELRARQALWEACEPELCADPDQHPRCEGVPTIERPEPRHPGPVEEYTERATVASLGAFGIAAASTHSLESASSAIFAGIPRQASHGRDAFASYLGTRLARAGVLVLDPHALRKLDRIDSVVVEGALLCEDDPGARDLVAAVRRAHLRFVAVTDAATNVAWAQPDRVSRQSAADMVHELQDSQRRVCYVGGARSPAHAMADCGMGVCSPAWPPPWGAHIFCRAGLGDAVLVIDAVTAAQRASQQSVRLSMVGAALGVGMAFYGLKSRTTRRVMALADVASILAMGNAVRLARGVEKSSAPPRDATPWHTLDHDEVLERLRSRLEGLADTEATSRRTERPPPPSPIVQFTRMVVDELATPMTPILAGGAGLSALTGQVVDAGLILGVLVANGIFGGAERYRTDGALARMARQEKRKVRVRRGQSAILGESTVLVDADQLVPGDVIELEAGDVVPADCRILEAVALEADESSLTGESLPVAKSAEPCQAEALAERVSMLYDSTAIAAGRAAAAVVAVGDDTEARRAMVAGQEHAPQSGVERRLDTLTTLTAPLAVVGGMALAAGGMLRGQPANQFINAGVSLAVAAVPEGLPLLATLAQLAAASRLSGHGALVRNPRAIEALGRVNVLCADKTGTLTEGRISLRTVSDGEVAQPIDALDEHHRRVLSVALRASPETVNGEPLPHMTDRALVDAARAIDVESHDGLSGLTRIEELPFEPSRGYHAGLARFEGGHLISVKGAPELILPRCRSWHRGGQVHELTDQTRAHLGEESMRLARRGFRVLAVAEREERGDGGIHDDHVQDLGFCGFLALADPIRPSARAAVDDLRGAGVSVVMVTGDHPSTAEAIAAELCLDNCEEVVTGPEIATLDEHELDEVVGRASVFARVTPMQKVRIVRAYKRIGRVVAMTGDGANDAPAIRLADVGIALGEGSTAAARSAADMIVIDERIETIVHAALEGRALWTSVRDAVSMLVGGNLGEIGFTVVGGLAAGASPLNARQLLLVNMLTDSFPALAVALRPPAGKTPEELLREGPDASLGGALTRDILWRAVFTGGAAAGAWLLGRLVPAREPGEEQECSRKRAGTMALMALTGAQLTQTLTMGGRSLPVLATGLGSLGALLAVVQTPGISRFFGCEPLTWRDLLLAGLATGASTALVPLPAALRRRRGTKTDEPA